MNEEVENALSKLHDRSGELTPEAVVRAAVKETSPLHNYFEWDDGIAAHHHRLGQARQLIRTVKIHKEEGSIRGYQPVRIDEGGQHTAYVRADRVAEVTPMRDQFRERLSQEIRGYVRRWKHHSAFYSLDDVLAEIESVWHSIPDSGAA